MSNNDKNYSPSASFVAVSFFAAITISVLCGNIYKLLEGVDLCKIFSASINCNFESINTIYAISLLIFLIKYFLDDIIGDINRNDNITSPIKLVNLGLGWTFFLLAATFVSNESIDCSAMFWLLGVIMISIVLICDFFNIFNQQPELPKKQSKVKERLFLNDNLLAVSCFLIQNIFIIVLLFMLTILNCNQEILTKILFISNAFLLGHTYIKQIIRLYKK